MVVAGGAALEVTATDVELPSTQIVVVTSTVVMTSSVTVSQTMSRFANGAAAVSVASARIARFFMLAETLNSFVGMLC